MKLKNILITSTVVLLIGCTAVNKTNSANLSNRISARASSSKEKINDAGDYDKAHEETGIRAERIAKAVNDMEGIEKVSVIITGNTAIIGIEVEGELTDNRLIEYKRNIEQVAKAADEGIDHVAVTAGPELIQRIDSIADFITDDNDAPEKKSNLTPKQENIINSLTPIF